MLQVFESIQKRFKNLKRFCPLIYNVALKIVSRNITSYTEFSFYRELSLRVVPCYTTSGFASPRSQAQYFRRELVFSLIFYNLRHSQHVFPYKMTEVKQHSLQVYVYYPIATKKAQFLITFSNVLFHEREN